jgi:hypothetical protein
MPLILNGQPYWTIFEFSRIGHPPLALKEKPAMQKVSALPAEAILSVGTCQSITAAVTHLAIGCLSLGGCGNSEKWL